MKVALPYGPEILMPWRIPVATPRAREHFVGRGVRRETIVALQRLQRKTGLDLAIIDRLSYQAIEAKLPGGTTVVFSGCDPRDVLTLLRSRTLHNLAAEVKKRFGVDVELIKIRSAAKQNDVYYLFDGPIEVIIDLATVNASSLVRIKGKLFDQLQHLSAWPAPQVWGSDDVAGAPSLPVG